MRALRFLIISAFLIFSFVFILSFAQKTYAVTNSCATTGCCNNTDHDQYDSKTGLKINTAPQITCSGNTCSAKVTLPTSSTAYNAITWWGPGQCTSAGYCFKRPFHSNVITLTNLQEGKAYGLKVSTSNSGGGIVSGYGVEYPGGACNYSFVANIAHPSPSPSVPPSLSPSPSPSSETTSVKVVLGLPGIGYSGLAPHQTTRPVTVELYAPTVQNPGGPGTSPLKSATGIVTYDGGTDNNAGYFVSNTPISFQNLASGKYQILIKIQRYLYKLAVNAADSQSPHVFTLNANTTTNLDPLILPSGDVAITSGQLNHLNILDYNVLVSCYGDKATTSSCPVSSSGSGGTNLADLNDDGKVDFVDLNIWLRSLRDLQAANAPGCDAGDCQGD